MSPKFPARALAALAMLFPLSVLASDWYVRPYKTSASYGTQSGLGYNDAFNGLAAINWTSIQPGDTLYVCGTHPDVDVSPSDGGQWRNLNGPSGTTHTQLVVGASGTEGSPIVIRFDCVRDDGSNTPDSGTILPYIRQFRYKANAPSFNKSEGWTGPDVYGVYTICRTGTIGTYIEHSYTGEVGSRTSTFTRLKRATKTPTEDPAQWSGAGVAYYASNKEGCSGTRYYYKPSNGVSETAFYGSQMGPAILVDNKDHVEIKGQPGRDPSISYSGRELTTVGSGITIRNGSDHVLLESVFVKYAVYTGIRPGEQTLGTGTPLPGCTYIEIKNSRVEQSQAGIYNSSNGDPNSPQHYHIHHNYISHIQDDSYWVDTLGGGTTDRPGIYFEAGNDNIIEHNHIEYAGEAAIGFDIKRVSNTNRNIVRYNFIREVGWYPKSVEVWGVCNTTTQYQCKEVGFEVIGTSAQTNPDNTHNNRVYNNIIVGANQSGFFIAAAGKPSVGYSWAFYNNVVFNTRETGLRFGDQVTPSQVGFYFMNNVVAHGGATGYAPPDHAFMRHVKHQQNAGGQDYSGLYIDYNLYNPDANPYDPIRDVFEWIQPSGPYWGDLVTDFAGWQVVTGINGGNAHGFDVNSPSPEDPRFSNACSGSYTQACDFQLDESSPAIDAGTSLVATGDPGYDAVPDRDFAGNPIYGVPDLGAYEYQPPYAMGVDRVDVSGNVRIYSDGRFRNTSAPSGQTVALAVSPSPAGWPSDDRSHYLDIEISQWDPSVALAWDENHPTARAVSHEIAELDPAFGYAVQVDGAPVGGVQTASGGNLSFVYNAADSGWHAVTVTKAPTANLSATITDSPDPVLVNGAVDYTVTVTNIGPSDATGVTVSGLTGCTLPGTTLASGATAQCSASVTAGSVGTLSQTVTVNGAEFDPDTANNSATATTTVNPVTDLAVTMTDGPDPVNTDGTLTYTVTVTNNGPSDATGVTTTHTLPSGIGGSATAGQGSCTGAGPITCTLDSLGSGQSATITITATPGAEALFDATASTVFNIEANASSSVTGAEADPTIANNSASTATTVKLACLSQPVTIRGTGGNDGSSSSYLSGGSEADVIHTLGGTDYVDGKGGNDTVCGGDGNDSLKGAGGNDALDGGLGTDTCNGGGGTDSAFNCEAVTYVP